jgi:hypothetical protein
MTVIIYFIYDYPVSLCLKESLKAALIAGQFYIIATDLNLKYKDNFYLKIIE